MIVLSEAHIIQTAPNRHSKCFDIICTYVNVIHSFYIINRKDLDLFGFLKYIYKYNFKLTLIRPIPQYYLIKTYWHTYINSTPKRVDFVFGPPPSLDASNNIDYGKNIIHFLFIRFSYYSRSPLP